MKIKAIFYLATLGFAINLAHASNLNNEQAYTDANDANQILTKIDQISLLPGSSRSTQYLSSIQNRRLAFSDGLSFDSASPQFHLRGNTYLSSFSRLNNDEQHFGLGLRFGENQFSAFTGKGEGFSRLSSEYTDIDPYYFHGGTTAAFRFNSYEWARQLSPQIALQIGRAVVKANNLEDRTTEFVGGQLGPINAHIMQVARGGDKAGRVLNLGFDSSFGDFNWSALRQISGGEIQQVTIAFKSNSRNKYNFSMATHHNPLTEDDDKLRVMFGLTRQLGREYLSIGEEKEKQDEKPNKNKYVILGGVAVGATVALSSGSDGQDTNSRLSSQHAAGRQALNNINPRSVQENREFGGIVYRTPDNLITFTAPVRGDATSVSIPFSLIPAGGVPLASYHTHAAADPRFLNEQFSPTDINSDNALRVDGYLGTPGGRFLWHDRSGNRIVRLGSIAN